jgi:hypothetical protein
MSDTPFNIEPIAHEINARAKSYAIGTLQTIRKELHGFSRRPGNGAENVADQHASGLGTKIDVVLRRSAKEFWYYEIKTALSPRACIREALGQVMEYAYWPGKRSDASDHLWRNRP